MGFAALDSCFRRNERCLYLGVNLMTYAGEKNFWVYMLARKRNGTLYIGSTDDLAKRIWQHKENVFKGFTSEYGVKMLAWCEPHDTREAAFTRERQLKKWKRAWKLELIEKDNPDWLDLYDTLNQ